MAIEIKWFPPSWFQMKNGETILYVDPAYLRTYFTNYPKRIEFSKWPDPIDGLPEDLEKADIVLITHQHKDHCKQVSVNRLRNPDTKVVAPKHCVRELGGNLLTVEPGEEMRLNGISIKAVDAYNLKHESSEKVMHKKGDGVGYLVNIYDRCIYHAGDTDVIPEMAAFGRIDLALLPIGGRGFTMNFDEAIRATQILRPEMVIPMHRFEADQKAWKKEVESKTGSVVVPLDIGETFVLK